MLTEEDITRIYQLDWIQILHKAIKGRKTSWSENPVHEWRNASDEVCMAVINELRKKYKLEYPLEKAKRELSHN